MLIRLGKSVLLLLFLFQAYIALGQEPRSEIVSRVSYLQLENGKLTRTDSVVLQINDRTGDVDAQINTYYSKGDKVHKIDAWLEDKDGNVLRKLKSKDILDRSAISDISLYEDDFVKEFQLKHSDYPYRVCYTTKITQAKFIGLYYYYPRLRPVRSDKVVLETDIPIMYNQKNIEEPIVSTLAEGKQKYLWEFFHQGYTPEANAWYDNDTVIPMLNIQPLNFMFKLNGSLDSWKSFGEWIFDLNRDKETLPESEKLIIDKLLNGIDGDKEKAKVLYKYLQENTRYINVSIKYGGMEAYPADYVCTNRYGDCKALSNYMKAMLTYAGIKSYYTPIYLGEFNPEIKDDFTKPSAFNHVILAIPFGTDTTFLECTSKNYPFGYVHTDIQGRKALLTDENNSRLISIPSLDKEDLLSSSKKTVRLFSETDADVSMKSELRGRMYEIFSSLANNLDKNKADSYIRKNIIQGNVELQTYDILNCSNDSAKILVALEYKCRNICKQYGNNLVLSSLSMPIPYYETPDKRVFGVRIAYPDHRKETVVYELPNVSIANKPKDIVYVSPYGEYSLKYEIEESRLLVYKSLLIKSGKYKREDYDAFYAFLQFVRSNENKNIYIEVI